MVNIFVNTENHRSQEISRDVLLWESWEKYLSFKYLEIYYSRNIKSKSQSFIDLWYIPIDIPTQPSGQVVQEAAAPKLCSVGERPQVEPVTGGSQRPQGLMVESPSQYEAVRQRWHVVRSTKPTGTAHIVNIHTLQTSRLILMLPALIGTGILC